MHRIFLTRRLVWIFNAFYRASSYIHYYGTSVFSTARTSILSFTKSTVMSNPHAIRSLSRPTLPLISRWFLCAAVLSLCIVIPQRVYAGGLEYSAPGAAALGRAGAVTARADNPMVLEYNPAGLAELRGTQFLFDLNLAIFSACVDPIGYYGWGTYNPSAGGGPSELINSQTGEQETIYLGIPSSYVEQGRISQQQYDQAQDYYEDFLDTVCMKQQYVPIPQLVLTKRISESLGIGAGLLFPAQQPVGQWGGENGVIIGESGDVRPSPVRYMQLRSSQIGLFPTIGLGYRIPGIERIRLGFALQWGMIGFTETAMAGSSGGTTPRGDAVYEGHAEDFFVPAVNVSAHIVPIDALDIVVGFKWQDKFDGDGDLYITTGVFDPTIVPIESKVKIDSATQRMPWKLRGGIRFADRIVPRPDGTGDLEGDEATKDMIHDPLSDERWDIELDVEFQKNSLNQSRNIYYPPGEVIWIENATGERRAVSYPAQVTDADGETTVTPSIFEKRWKDQLSVRLGGTVNVLRGVLGVSVGGHWENRGIDPNYMQLDFWPVSRWGLHGGLIVRLFRSFDLTLSYAHIFQETIVVQPPPHLPASEIDANATDPSTADKINIDKSVGMAGSDTGREIKEETPVKNPDGTASIKQVTLIGTAGMPQWVTNSGTYRSNYNIVAAGVNLHF